MPKMEHAIMGLYRENGKEHGDYYNGMIFYVALRMPTTGDPLGTYNRNRRESERVEGLRSKLGPKQYYGFQLSRKLFHLFHGRRKSQGRDYSAPHQEVCEVSATPSMVSWPK